VDLLANKMEEGKKKTFINFWKVPRIKIGASNLGS
jgi:hypothetical protein